MSRAKSDFFRFFCMNFQVLHFAQGNSRKTRKNGYFDYRDLAKAVRHSDDGQSSAYFARTGEGEAYFARMNDGGAHSPKMSDGERYKGMGKTGVAQNVTMRWLFCWDCCFLHGV